MLDRKKEKLLVPRTIFSVASTSVHFGGKWLLAIWPLGSKTDHQEFWMGHWDKNLAFGHIFLNISLHISIRFSLTTKTEFNLSADSLIFPWKASVQVSTE